MSTIMTITEINTLRGRLAANPDTLVDPHVVRRLMATVDQLLAGRGVPMSDFRPAIPPRQVTL